MTYAAGIGAAVGVFLAAYFLFIAPPAPPASDTGLGVGAAAFPRDGASAPDLASAVGTSSLSLAAPSGTEEYRNTRYGFSLAYPNGLAVSTINEGDGASTIVFQNVEEAKGFQIFIVPYHGELVSRERFRRDNPSGVMDRPTNILVGGAKATMFYSANVALGDTIEVWVIKNGYLFEITAPKSLDRWLAAVMQTWEFL